MASPALEGFERLGFEFGLRLAQLRTSARRPEQEGEVMRTSSDGRLVVAPLPFGDRFMLSPDEVVRR